MTKLSQLKDIQRLGLPVPRFQGLTYEQFRQLKVKVRLKDHLSLRFPVSVRSAYSAEDGEEKSYAGAFQTILNVANDAALHEAIQEVFASYPETAGQSLIVQEMVEAEYSGVLFAYRQGVWKCEWTEGMGEQLVSARVNPEPLLLPKFSKSDLSWSAWYRFWEPWAKQAARRGLERALIRLSYHTQKLIAYYQAQAQLGLDIEFAVRGSQVYFLQARPITTASDQEEVLTSANHKEILPPQPSHYMTSLISDCSRDLFAYYQGLDSSLAPRNFIISSGEMPWINLSALLDVMLHWGLPTSLVCDSVGAEDFYRVKIRPYRALTKLKVFWKVFWAQQNAIRDVREWLEEMHHYLEARQQARWQLWSEEPEQALEEHWDDLRKWYIELVTHMQNLTGSMSGPLKLAQTFGWLQSLATQLSESTRYLEAYRGFLQGRMSQEDFLKNYGHRGFYESDIGQKRFYEYTHQDWEALKATVPTNPNDTNEHTNKRPHFLQKLLLAPLIKIIHLRERIRHEAMKMLWMLRQEIQMNFQRKVDNKTANFADYDYQDLRSFFNHEISQEELGQISYPEPSGWDMNTFLASASGKRTLLTASQDTNTQDQGIATGLGIYPGKRRGQVWRVHQADLVHLQKPDFEHTILVADSLDPGWVPYFLQVEGVISYVGGLLSHASIVLRESAIPAITQIPNYLELHTGDWIEMDGGRGEVRKIKD